MPSLTSLTKSVLNQVSQQACDAYLIELDSEGRPVAANTDTSDAASAGRQRDPTFAFQYFPETVSDSKAVNYQSKEIPGGSLPLHQWISGGERTLSFTAIFTTDVDLDSASSPGGLGTGNGSDIQARLKAAGVERRNIDIRAAVGLLRRFMYPSYLGSVATEGQLTVAPPMLRLVLTNSGLGIAGASASAIDSVRCFMTQCDVNWEAWFPSGPPRIATVQLSFLETAQFGGYIEFPDRRNIDARLREADYRYDFPPRVRGQRG